MTKVKCEGEIVLREELFKRIVELLGLSPDNGYKGEKVVFKEVKFGDGIVNVKFEGDISWADPLAEGENPLDWLSGNSLALVWDVPELKLLEVKGDTKLLKFYSEEELERKRKEYTGWWLDSMDNISGLLG